MLISNLRRSLLCFVVLLIFVVLSDNSAAQTVNLQNGLIAYYPFNGNANDASGNSINGTVSGAQLTTDRFGNANGAYRFNGASDFIRLPFSQLYNFKPSDAYSLSVWVQHEASSNVRSVVVKSPYTSFYQTSQWNYGICITDNDIMSIGYHDNFVLKSDLSLTPQEPCWYLLTSTYSDGRWKLYINGELQKQDMSQTRRILQDGSSSIVFGKKGEADGDYYKGKMDEVRIYNRMLSDEEVKALYTQGTPCTKPVACNSWLNNPAGSSGMRVGDLDVTGNKLTVEALINRTAPYTGDYHYAGNVVAKHTGTPDCNYLLRPSNAEITTTNGYVSTPLSCEIELNKTYHIAMVYDGQKLKFYRNGFLMGEVACTGDMITNDWITTIGEIPLYPKIPSEAFIGYINEVRIWNVARTQEDIKKYMSTSLPNTAAQTGLLAYYTFDNLLNKQGDNTWNGTLVGSATTATTNPKCVVATDSCPVTTVVTAAFTAPDTICANTAVTVKNNSENASRYYWNFNTASVQTQPDAVNLGNISGRLNVPVFGDIVQANGNYHVFVVNHNTFELIRLDFGNSLLNTPTAVALNIPWGYKNTEGIQVVFNENKWYAFAVGGNPQISGNAYLLKIEFGADITNMNPTLTNLGNVGSMLFPHDLYMFRDGASWYGLTVNKDGNSITRINFTQSFNNTPTGVNLGTIGGLLKDPVGICAIKNNDQWHVFVAEDNVNAGLVRLDFGNSLLNTPTGQELKPNIALTHLRDVHIMPYCDGISGFIIDGAQNVLYRLDFGNAITGTPVVSSYGNTGNLSFPHSLSKFFRVGGDLYSFITNAANHTITRVRFSSSTSLPSEVSSVANPPAYTYTTPGVYNINLVVDEGLFTQASYCKSIVVKDCSPPVTAAFAAPDTVCVNIPVKVNNLSVNATKYYWNFNSADINKQPVSVNLGNIGNSLTKPVFTDIVEANGNYYVFVVNHIPAGITRLDFGNSLLNTPTAVPLNLNGMLPTTAEGIQVVFNENKWYAFVVGGNPKDVPSFLVKMEFGASITNATPVVTNLGNIGNMSFPLDLYMFKEGSNWYGLTVSTDKTLIRFNFTGSFNNTPTGINLGNINGMLSEPTGIFPIKVNDQWHVFVGNDEATQGVVRLDFGNSLLNTPTATLLNTNVPLSHIRDLYIMSSCDGFAGFVVDGTINQLFMLNFGSSITNTPVVTSYGNTGNLSFPHSLSKMFRVGGDLYSFITNVNNNTITRVRFSSSVVVSGSVSSLATPAAVTYTIPGRYNINLVVNEGLPTQSSFCKSILVIAPYAKVPVTDTVVCTDSAVLKTRFTTTPHVWNNGAVADSMVIKTDGTYWVHTDAYGCAARDTFIYAFRGLQQINLGNDTTICEGEKVVKTFSVPAATYQWQDGSTANSYTMMTEGKYKLIVKNSWCSVADSMLLQVTKPPQVTVMNDTTLCDKDTFTLRAPVLVYTDSLRWTPQTGLRGNNTASPRAFPLVTTQYKLTAYNKGCAKADSVVVTVNPAPVLVLNADTAVCAGKQVPLQVSGAAVYQWQPAAGITNTALASQTVSPAADTRYYVKGTGANGCSATDSVLVTINLPAVFALTPEQATVCAGDSVTLAASGGSSLRWLIQGQESHTGTVLTFLPPLAGNYAVEMYDAGCNRLDTLYSLVTINDKPVLAVTSSNDIDCVQGESRLNVTGGATYVWYPAATLTGAHTYNPIARTDTSTWYHVAATGFNGCTSEDSVLVRVLKNNFNVYPIATAFSPNGDGKNDCFGVNKWGFIKSMQLVIYNRWGEKVFITSNPYDCWDGRYKGEAQPPGAFVYTIKASTLCGTVSRNGTVVLIR